ncbi:hypothetical protein CSB11_02535 [Candidatus Campbellbacteria bacterium]|nr:MAG: hypothetical protein CSB11_02535 [Candidatus Campbellbacteria bacterium]
MNKIISLKKNTKSYTLLVELNGIQKRISLKWGTRGSCGSVLVPSPKKVFWDNFESKLGTIYFAEKRLKKVGDIFYFDQEGQNQSFPKKVYPGAAANELFHKARGGC